MPRGEIGHAHADRLEQGEVAAFRAARVLGDETGDRTHGVPAGIVPAEALAELGRQRADAVQRVDSDDATALEHVLGELDPDRHDRPHRVEMGAGSDHRGGKERFGRVGDRGDDGASATASRTLAAGWALIPSSSSIRAASAARASARRL